MITRNKQTTTVEFSKGGAGTISVGISGLFCTLTLQQVIDGRVRKIGDTLKPEDIKDLPKVVLQFHTEKSIDVVIQQLQKLKGEMRLFDYARAC